MGLVCVREQSSVTNTFGYEVHKTELVPVVLHVYDVGMGGGGAALNHLLKPLGTGAFHCGVEVHGWEWSYSDISGFEVDPHTTGVFSCVPRSCEGHSYVLSVLLGSISISAADFLRMVEMLEREWTVADYDLLRHNCCHFADEFCMRLGVGHVPSWVMSLAIVGDALVSAPAKMSDCACCRVLGFEVVSHCCKNSGTNLDEHIEAIPMLGKQSVFKATAEREGLVPEREVLVHSGTTSGPIWTRVA